MSDASCRNVLNLKARPISSPVDLSLDRDVDMSLNMKYRRALNRCEVVGRSQPGPKRKVQAWPTPISSRGVGRQWFMLQHARWRHVPRWRVRGLTVFVSAGHLPSAIRCKLPVACLAPARGRSVVDHPGRAMWPPGPCSLELANRPLSSQAAKLHSTGPVADTSSSLMTRLSPCDIGLQALS